MAGPELQRMSEEEFFAWQEKQERLYELVDGLPVLPLKMMTGASQAHDRALVNIIAALGNQLRGGPCRPTTDILAVRTSEATFAALTSRSNAVKAAVATWRSRSRASSSRSCRRAP